MSSEVLVLILAGLTNILLALFVLSKNAKSASHLLFAILAGAFGVEPVVNYFSLHSDHHLLFIRLVMFMVVIMGQTFLWLSLTYPRNHMTFSRRRIYEAIGAFVVAVVALTPLLFSGVTIDPSGNITPTPGPGLALFIVGSFYAFGYGSYCLISRYRRSRGLEKVQLQYMVIGALAAFGLSFICDLILPVAFKVSLLVALSPVYLAIFSVCIAIAIVRHRLFNVRLIVARSVAYTLLLTTLGAVYGLVLFSISRYFYPGLTGSVSQNAIYTIVAVLLAFTFQPLRRFFEHLTDSIFFRDRYDSQEVLNAIGKTVLSEFQLEPLLMNVLTGISHHLKIANARFYVFDDGKIYQVQHFGAVPTHKLSAGDLTVLRRRILIADELSGGREKALMDREGIRVSIHLRTNKEFVGYLILGDKLSGEIYSSQDIDVLEILAQELAVAISNAKAYEDIAHFNITLQQKVADATKRLREANTHLKELDQAKDIFISMASHQLRTPLTSIKGYLSMLLEGDAGPLRNQQKEFVETAYNGSQRMINLIGDLLNVSRMSAGKFMIEKASVDLVKLVAEEVTQLVQHAEAKGLKLRFIPPKGKLPTMNLDEDKTRQVVMNFIDNAIYYTKNGAVTVRLSRKGDRVELRVEDTGIGVPKDAQKHLFTKFYRAGNAQTMRPDGTGLGLYLAKRVIEDQGGVVIFETTEGKGSTFGFSMGIA